MRVCLSSPAAGGLGWTPEAFWRATPREVAMALGRGDAPALARATLETLLARYPDARARRTGDDDA
ncbi:phage tail assembly chaperone [Breoghania sp. L-A4]|uniref:phage tail assembly chaperone n=1 Tax=Breoghania sp. L-A4 TaxID=2304600 RepID=UPI0020C03CC5|nr:phage tail assembly chaperone [Breoghania sp. L-A4]